MKFKVDLAVMAFLLLAEAHITLPLAAATIEVVPAPAECILAVNLTRAAKLSKRLSVLEGDSDAEAKAKQQLQQVVNAANNECDQLAAQEMSQVSLFSARYQGSAPPCKEGMQELLSRFLMRPGVAEAKTLPRYFPTVEPWSSLEGGLLAQVLYSKSRKIGCAMTQNCNSSNVIVCVLEPTIEENEVPFSDAVLKALKARASAGYSIADMTADDLAGIGSGIAAVQALSPPAMCIISLAVALLLQ